MLAFGRWSALAALPAGLLPSFVLAACDGARSPGAARPRPSAWAPSPGAQAPGAQLDAKWPRARCESELPTALLSEAPALPARVGGFCLSADLRPRVARWKHRFLAEAPACDALVGPGCADRFPGAVGFRSWPLVDPALAPAQLEVRVLDFVDASHAYAVYTRELAGDRDPALSDAVVLDADGRFALLGERVVAYLGPHLLELEYRNEAETLSERRDSARARLRRVVEELSSRSTAAAGLPEAASRLPTEHRLALGVRFFVEDALGVVGLGENAQGFHQSGDRRWRTLCIARSDAEAAKDVMSTLRRHADSKKLKYAPLGAMRFTQRRKPTQPHVEWMIGQAGRFVYGVGDEASVLPEFTSAEDQRKVTLTSHEKLLRLADIHRK